MSTKASGANNSVPTNAELAQTVSTLQDELEAEREARQELEQTVEEQSKEIEQLQQEIERAEDNRSHLLDDIIDVEEQIGELEAGSPDAKGEGNAGKSAAQRPEMTPIERLSRIDDMEDTAVDVTPSIERAVTIFDYWREWSNKTPKGRVLKDNLKSLLRTATGDNLNWKQSYRAAEALEELSKGRIQFIHHSRHGKMLIEPPRPNGDCHSSKAATS